MGNANEQVRGVLDRLVEDGTEVGIQVAAYLNGSLVIDAWSGMADPSAGIPVTADTLFMVASCTKGVVATCIHVLADRGSLEYDAPICRYWPEFAARGKENTTVRHALMHEAGIPQMPEMTSSMMILDWDKMCAAVADLEPLWEAGTKVGYHALTFGWILGEVIRKVDGRPVGQFVQEEICQPLGMRDIFIGIPEEDVSRVAKRMAPPPMPDMAPFPPDLLIFRAIPPALLNDMEEQSADDFQDYIRASIPAANGVMTARALSRHYAMLAHGGALDGARVLSDKGLKIAAEIQPQDLDEVVHAIPGFPRPIRRSLGYWHGGECVPSNDYHGATGLSVASFGHPGMGGMSAFADPEQGFSMAILKNFSTPMGGALPDSTYVVAQEIRRSLDLND
ncbi:MAG: serine hydrolase domain-containing protein [Desulfobacterales bacterium]